MSLSSKASFHVHVGVSREKAWGLLRDLSLAHNYVPGLVATEITTEYKEGVGASRKVYQSQTKGIDETVEEWNDGCGFLIRLHRGDAGPPLPFKNAWFRYAIADDGDGIKLTTSLVYVMRWGLIGQFLDRILLNRIIKGRIRDVGLSLKIYWETGKRVTPERLKQARAVGLIA